MDSDGERNRITALIVIVALGLGMTLAIGGGPQSLLEDLGLALIVFGWFVVAPVYHFWWAHRSASGRVDRDSAPSAQRASDAAGAEDPLSTLQRRYAAGDLSESEFERRLERLLGVEGLDLEELADATDERADRSTDEHELEFE